MDAQRITIALIDRSEGYEASPNRVRLGELVDFAGDVATFLRGDSREIDTTNLEVAIKDGSLAIETAPLTAAPNLFRDLRLLGKSESLNNVDVKRRDVLERWQKQARGTRQLGFRISAPFLKEPVMITAETDFHADDADQWVMVERYVRGEVQDLGGATRANAHVRFPDGRLLKVNADHDVLRDDSINRLYKQAVLRIKAEYNVLTRELRNAKLIEFVEYAPRFDAADMSRLTRRGAEAWRDVGNATEWVDDLRGGDE